MGRICIFGDSIVHWVTDPFHGWWTQKLKQHIEKEDWEFRYSVFPLGIPGETSTWLLQRIYHEASIRNPKTIIIAIGINDTQYAQIWWAYKTSKDIFQQNIEEIASIAWSVAEEVIFIGLTRVNDAKTMPLFWRIPDCFFENQVIQDYDTIIQSICANRWLPYISVFSLLREEDIFEDALHPNTHGYDKMFRYINNRLVEIGIHPFLIK